MAERRLKHFGWGREGEGLTAEEEAATLDRYRRLFAVDRFDERSPPALSEIALRQPRIVPPPALAPHCSSEPYDRVAHTYGKSFSDYARGLAGHYDNAPDVVAYPNTEAEVAAVVDWATGAQAALIPFGAGSSVVGGIEPAIDGTACRAAISLDLRHLDRVVEIDRTSRAARIEAGVFGPALEAQLKPHGVTLRHFPQSFEYSTLGGWIATRSGGHFATPLHAHRRSRRKPARRDPARPRRDAPSARLRRRAQSRPVVHRVGRYSRSDHRGLDAAAGPATFSCRGRGAFRRLLLGCPRGQSDRPGRDYILLTAASSTRRRRTIPERETGRRQSWCWPSNSGDHPLDAWIGRALECCADHGGTPEHPDKADAHREGAAGLWRNAFIRMPYARERLVGRAIIADTFETAITWERFEAFHDAVKTATEAAIREATGRPGQVTCRFTHVYPDGPAPYFTFHALGRHGELSSQWRTIKIAASEALIAAGGTITHHHAVGRDHRPWYDKQRPELFAAVLQAAKRALDPQGMLNPGVLIDLA